MNISFPTTAASAWSAAAPARACDGAASDPGDAQAGGRSTPDAGPDVVVTLNQPTAAAATYDASGRMAGASAANDDQGDDDDATDASPDAPDDAAQAA